MVKEVMKIVQNFFGKNEKIGLQKKWLKKGHRIDNADITSEFNPSLHVNCNRGLSSKYTKKIGLILKVIVIGIVNPIPLFQSLFLKSYPLIFSKIVINHEQYMCVSGIRKIQYTQF